MRVTVQQGPELVTLKIEGRLADAFVAELDRTWRELAPVLGTRKLSVDLCGVTFIDTTGRLLLAQMYAKTGAQFLADRPMTKYYAAEAMAKNSNGFETEQARSMR